MVFLEVACSIVFDDQLGPGERDLQLMGWRAESNATIDGVNVNAVGFTGDVLTTTRKDPEEIRVLCLGASVIFYLNTTEEIRKSLQALTPRKISIVSTALPTHTLRSSRIKYDLYFNRFDFDYVLIYHGINDLWANYHSPEVFREDYTHLNAWYRRTWLLDHSIAARVFYNRKIWKRPPIPDSGVIENLGTFSSCTSFENNLNHLVTEIQNRGAQPILMTFASNIPRNYTSELFRADKLGYAQTDEHNVNGLDAWGPPGYVAEGLRRHNEIVKQIAAEKDTFLLDQHWMLSGEVTNFVDPCHFSREGQRRFLVNLVRLFQTEELLPAPNP